MIGKHLRQIKRYCKDPIEWIENYQEAMSDKTQKWECHHKKEIELGVGWKELISMGLYWKQPAEDLIFLTKKDHKQLHANNLREKTINKLKNNKKDCKWYTNGYVNCFCKECPEDFYQGYTLTEETKQKKSNASKGINNPNYGKHHTEEIKQKISEQRTKHHISKEELYDLYIVQGLSQQKIADLYGCNQRCIQRKLKNFDISKKVANTPINISEEQLYELYISKNLTIIQIGEIFSCTPSTIYNKLQKYNIKK